MLRIFILLIVVFISACQKEAPPEPRRLPVMNYSKVYQTSPAQQQVPAQQNQPMAPMPLQAPAYPANGGGQANLQQSNLQVGQFPQTSSQGSEMKSWEQPVPNPTYEEHNSVFAFPGLFGGNERKEPAIQKRRPVGYADNYGNDMPSASAPRAMEPRRKAPQMSETPKSVNQNNLRPNRILKEDTGFNEMKLDKRYSRKYQEPRNTRKIDDDQVDATPEAKTGGQLQPIPPLQASDKTDKIPSDMKTYQQPIAKPVTETADTPQEIGSMEVIETEETTRSSAAPKRTYPPVSRARTPRKQRYMPPSRYQNRRTPQGDYMRH